MVQPNSRASRHRGVFAAFAVLAAASGAFAQGAPEVYNATASLKTPGGVSVTAPVVVSISRWSNDAERGKALQAVKAGATAGLQKELAGQPEVGFLQVGQVKTPLRYAHSRPVGEGKIVMVAASQPVAFVGAGMRPDAKPRAGYDVAIAILQVDGAGKGDTGDLALAAKVKFDDAHGFVIEDYGTEALRLGTITKK